MRKILYLVLASVMVFSLTACSVLQPTTVTRVQTVTETQTINNVQTLTQTVSNANETETVNDTEYITVREYIYKTIQRINTRTEYTEDIKTVTDTVTATKTETSTIYYERQKATSKSIAMTGVDSSVTQLDGDSVIVEDQNVEFETAGTDVVNATVPLKTAEKVMQKLVSETESVDNTKNREMVLILTVDKLENQAESDSASYNIDVSAKLTYTPAGSDTEITVEIDEVGTLDDFATIPIQTTKGLSNVNVYHSGSTMTEVTTKSSIADLEGAGEGCDAGYYNYNTETGILTIWSKSFSPFKITFDPAVASIKGTLYYSLKEAANNAKSGEIIDLLSAGNFDIDKINSEIDVAYVALLNDNSSPTRIMVLADELNNVEFGKVKINATKTALSNVSSITIIGNATQNVVIKTNDGYVTLTGKTNIQHYGTASKIDVDIDDTSYFEEKGVVLDYISAYEGNINVLDTDHSINGFVFVMTSATIINIEKDTPVVFLNTLTGDELNNATESVLVSDNHLTNIITASSTIAARIGYTQFFDNITNAYLAAENGNTIVLLQDQDMATTTIITKSITLDGNNHTLIGGLLDDSGYGTDSSNLEFSGFVINNDNVTIKNVRLTKMGNYAVIKSTAQNTIIDNVQIDDFSRMGIDINGENACATITNCYIDMTNMKSDTGNGIQIEYGATAYIYDTVIENVLERQSSYTSAGICFWDDSIGYIDGCVFNNCTYAFGLENYGASNPLTLSISNTIIKNCSYAFDSGTEYANNNFVLTLDSGNNFSVSNTIGNYFAHSDTSYQLNATITINGGTYTANDGNNALFTFTDYDNNESWRSYLKADITIDGGDFYGDIATASTGTTIDLPSDDIKITVTGGTFDRDPSDYVDHDSYEVSYDGGKYFVDDAMCFAGGTMITLSNGTKKAIEDITTGDKLLVWDFFTGNYAEKEVILYVDHGINEYTVLNLVFSDDSALRIVGEHGLFDYDLNKFVYIASDNYVDYIGHRFVKYSTDGQYSLITLADAYTTKEVTNAYSIASEDAMNAFAEGILTVAPPQALFTWITMGEKLKYDNEAFINDISEYGLYSYEDVQEYITYEQFEEWNIAYLKIPVEKGLFTFEYLLELFNEYKIFFV